MKTYWHMKPYWQIFNRVGLSGQKMAERDIVDSKRWLSVDSVFSASIYY